MIEQSGFIAFEEGDYVIRAKVDADQSGEEIAKAKLRVTFQATDEVIESAEFQIPGTKDKPTIVSLNARLKKGSYRVGVLFLNPHKMKSVQEGDGTLLDNCMIAYGSAISDPNRHNHHDLPIIVAGKGGGTIQSGRYIRYPEETPLNNLWLAMLDRFGAPSQKLGDSTGVLGGLS